ncbi:DUF1972 domain-containing protein [Pedobacter lithocola]|uniref:DUF1972 domain-containing protein n=1 Tax=Pedobacter lithocola TaxID=1908239 RepID=A0ABV8P543_9SPHI
MRIAILGTRGIPSQYGGFEKCAEHIAVSLAERGHEVIVYNSHNHANQKEFWKGIKIIHIDDPEFKLGSFGRFLYDYRCLTDLKNHKCDIILQLGYRSSPVWKFKMPKEAILVTIMGGLEWKRTKYNLFLRKFIVFAEKLAVSYCDNLIADSLGIQSYLLKKFHKHSQYIPYGADIFNNTDEKILAKFQVLEFKYDLFIGSLEPENSLEMILDGVIKAQLDRDFLVVGNHLTKNGNHLKNKYQKYAKIKFLGGIYDDTSLNNLRYYSNLYYIVQTSGGTNSLLLNAMACRCLISAQDNEFNRLILGMDALYFNTVDDITLQMIASKKESHIFKDRLDNNVFKIENYHSWKNIGERYEYYFCDLIKNEFVTKNDYL